MAGVSTASDSLEDRDDVRLLAYVGRHGMNSEKVLSNFQYCPSSLDTLALVQREKNKKQKKIVVSITWPEKEM